jgi:hypothetical protein
MKRYVVLAVLLLVGITAIAWDTSSKARTFTIGSGLLMDKGKVGALCTAWDTTYTRLPVVDFSSYGEWEDMILFIKMDSTKQKTTAKSTDSLEIKWKLLGASEQDTNFVVVVYDSMNTSGDSLKYYLDPQTLYDAHALPINRMRLDIYFEDRKPASGIEFEVGAERVLCIRMDHPEQLNGVKIPPLTQYALRIVSDRRVIIQFGRLDATQVNLAYYTTMGYACN